MKRLALLALFVLPLLGAAAPGADPLRPLDPEVAKRLPELAQARAAADSVTLGTRALLMREIAAQGTARALSACGTMALQEAMRHEQEGWRVRRVSAQWRNPADAPDRYEARVLRHFEALRKRGVPLAEVEWAEATTLDGRPVLRYLRPVAIANELCLQCHGEPFRMASDVRTALKASYPKDRAVGYRLGDLRGAISIAIPLEGPQP